MSVLIVIITAAEGMAGELCGRHWDAADYVILLVAGVSGAPLLWRRKTKQLYMLKEKALKPNMCFPSFIPFLYYR